MVAISVIVGAHAVCVDFHWIVRVGVTVVVCAVVVKFRCFVGVGATVWVRTVIVDFYNELVIMYRFLFVVVIEVIAGNSVIVVVRSPIDAENSRDFKIARRRLVVTFLALFQRFCIDTFKLPGSVSASSMFSPSLNSAAL